MEWKFKIGDFVVPVMQHGYEHASKMLVLAHVAEEYAAHTERFYVCSHFKLGDCVRQRFAESELAAWTLKS